MLARAIALTAIISSGATDWLRELWAQQGFDVTRSTSSASLRWPVDVTFERLLDVALVPPLAVLQPAHHVRVADVDDLTARAAIAA